MVTKSFTRLNPTFARYFNFVCRNWDWFSTSSKWGVLHYSYDSMERRKYQVISDLRRFGLNLSNEGLKHKTASGFLFKDLTNQFTRSTIPKELGEYGDHNRKVEILLELWERLRIGRLSTIHDLKRITYLRNLFRSLEALFKSGLVIKIGKKFYSLTDKGKAIAQYINQILVKFNKSTIFIVRSPFVMLEFSGEYNLISGLRQCLHLISSRHHGGQFQILIYVPSRLKKRVKPSVMGRDIGFDIVIDIDLTENEMKASIPLIFEQPLYVGINGTCAEICEVNISSKTIKLLQKSEAIFQDEENLSTFFGYVKEKNKIVELATELRKLISKRINLRETTATNLHVSSHLMCKHKYYWTFHLTRHLGEDARMELFLHPSPSDAIHINELRKFRKDWEKLSPAEPITASARIAH